MPALLRALTPRHTAAVALTILLAGGAPWPATATDTPDQTPPMALTAIMRDMGQDMQAVTDAITREDWPTVAAVAARIADHPQPPLAEKVRILAFIGKDTASFRDYDQQTHDAAQQLARAAQGGDGAGTITAFANVQTACLACHQRFRQPFHAHFHSRP